MIRSIEFILRSSMLTPVSCMAMVRTRSIASHRAFSEASDKVSWYVSAGQLARKAASYRQISLKSNRKFPSINCSGSDWVAGMRILSKETYFWLSEEPQDFPSIDLVGQETDPEREKFQTGK